MVRLLTDADVRRVLDMRVAIDAVNDALRERAAGTARSLPRQGIEVGEGSLVLTAGGFEGLRSAGLRVYAAGYEADEQLVAVWDAASGRLQTIVVGNLLGAVRTGAIGGAAIELLSRPDSSTLALIGPGRQGHMQLVAALAVRPLKEVRIHRRTAELCRAQAKAWTEELGVQVVATETAEEAVADADVVVLATRSAEPVLRATWLKRGAHVNTLGPKWRAGSEIGMDLIERADVLTSDFPEQYGQEEEFILHGTRHLERVQDLAALAASGSAPGREQISVFLSHGLAGTEVAVARALARRAAALGVGIEVDWSAE